MTPDEFRRAGHELVDWIADYRASVAAGERPVLAQVQPGALRAALPAAPPQDAEPMDAIRRDLDALILPACTNWQSPDFFGYFPSNSALAAVLGDFVSTGLAQLGLNWQSSPALTELEEVCLDWWRQMLGLSERWSGVIQDTASTATFADSIRMVLPDSVEEGTLYSVGGSATLTHTFQWETAKSALNYVTRAFSTASNPVSWRINGDATIDAGRAAARSGWKPASTGSPPSSGAIETRI